MPAKSKQIPATATEISGKKISTRSGAASDLSKTSAQTQEATPKSVGKCQNPFRCALIFHIVYIAFVSIIILSNLNIFKTSLSQQQWDTLNQLYGYLDFLFLSGHQSTRHTGSYENEAGLTLSLMHTLLNDQFLKSDHLAYASMDYKIVTTLEGDTLYTLKRNTSCICPQNFKEHLTKEFSKTIIEQHFAEAAAKWMVNAIHTTDGELCKLDRELQYCDDVISPLVFRTSVHRTILRPKSDSLGSMIDFLKSLYLYDVSFETVYSGSFDYNVTGSYTSAYHGLSNAQLRVTPVNALLKQDVKTIEFLSHDKAPRSLLLASHYDGAMQSPAIADCGSCIAIMLTVASELLKKNEIKAPLLLNMNGSEETILQAAHGFTQLHPWAHQVGVVYNLEAAGSGGLPHIIQVGRGSAELIRLYSEIKVPHANSLVTYLFEKRVVPGDTDFRIFDGNLDVIGLDFAIGRRGHYYHTVYDDLKHLDSTSVLRYYETILHLTRSTLNSMFEHLKKSGAVVSSPIKSSDLYDTTEYSYFDLSGYYFVYFPTSWVPLMFSIGIILWTLCLKFESVTIDAKFNISELAHFVSIFLFPLLLVCFVNVIIGSIMHYVGLSFQWYSSSYFAFAFYGVTAVLALYAAQQFLLHKTSGGIILTEQFLKIERKLFHSGIMMFSILYLYLSYAVPSFSYYPAITCMLSCLGRLVALGVASLLARIKKNLVDPCETRKFSISIIFFQLIVALIPTITALSISTEFILSFMPVLGRIPYITIPADAVVGVLVAILTYFSTYFVLNLLFLCTIYHKKTINRYLPWIALIYLIAITYISRGNFNNEFPKRIQFRHFVEKTMNSSGKITINKSGIWVICSDSQCLDRGGSQMKKLLLTPNTSNLHFEKMDFAAPQGYFDWPFVVIHPVPHTVDFIPSQNPLDEINIDRNYANVYHLESDPKQYNTYLDMISPAINSIPHKFIRLGIMHEATYDKEQDFTLFQIKLASDYRLGIRIPDQDVIRWSLGSGIPKLHHLCNCHWITVTRGRGEPFFTFSILLEGKVGFRFTATTAQYENPSDTLLTLLDRCHSNGCSPSWAVLETVHYDLPAPK